MQLSTHNPTPTPRADPTHNDWPDDDATLEAALALVDEWEFDASPDCPGPGSGVSSSSSLCSQPPASPPSQGLAHSRMPAGKLRRPKMRGDADRAVSVSVPVHVQRREELVFLRDKIQELTAQLAATQEQRGDAINTTSLGANSLDATRVWQEIALRQLRNRQKSEAENGRLRGLVQEQLAVAKQLARVLLRGYRAPGNGNGNGNGNEGDATSTSRITLPRDGLANKISLAEQRRRVLELYDEREAAFSESPFDTQRAVFREVNVLEHANGETTVNVGSSWAVPFPIDCVTNAFWKSLVQKLQRMDRDFNGRCDDGRDEVVTRYESTAAATRLVGKFVGRFVGRRFHAEVGKPPVIIGDVNSNPVDFKPLSMNGVQLHQEIIMRVVAAAEAQGGAAQQSTSGPHLSLVQLSSRIHIQFAGSGTPTRKRRVDALTNYLLYTVEDELAWKQEVLESLLLKDTMESSSSTA